MNQEVSILRISKIAHALVVAVICIGAIGYDGSACADTLVVAKEGKEVSLVGELLFEALDKSILFEATDGQLHIFESKEIVSLKKDSKVTPSMNHKQLGAALLQDLPDGFKIHSTKHYVIAYQTEPAFAKWIANLYEKRLFKKFEDFAGRTKYELSDSKFPLSVVVFGSRPEYVRYATRELGADPGSVIAFYSQTTNRVAMYDLTFTFGSGTNKRNLDLVLQQPAAIPMVTTIIHEATHQLMFNRGMQVRLADAPLWLNEGMANWFEAPDLNNKKGWRNPGLMNNFRLGVLRAYLPKRPANSISTLISTDERFAGEGAFDAYAESWALVYFLLKTRKDEFRDYLKLVSKKRPGIKVDAKQRMAEFVACFGNLKKLDKEFLKYVNKLKMR